MLSQRVDLPEELQVARDMLQVSINQRNASQNECLQLVAQIAAKDRELATARQEMAELKAKLAPEPEARPNGHVEAHVPR